MGSLFMRGITLFLGYVYPAYECFKSIEGKSKSRDAEEQIFWCQYWVLIAFITFLERIADVLISWLPMYSEAKLAFIVYLWYPKTKGTHYIYTNFLKPIVTNYEPEIDRKLLELKAQAAGLAKFFELLHCLASPPIRLQAYKQYIQEGSQRVELDESIQERVQEKEDSTMDCTTTIVSTVSAEKTVAAAAATSSIYKATRSRYRATCVRG